MLRGMSVRENIELYGLEHAEQFVELLSSEIGATKHPRQEDAYVLESLPFLAPRRMEDHISILSFNNVPLPDSLIEALLDHPEFFPDGILFRWTQEKDLLFEATLGQLRGRDQSA